MASILAAAGDCHVDEIQIHVFSNEDREVETFALGFRSSGHKKTHLSKIGLPVFLTVTEI
jgi:hypothetical protein